MAKRIALKDHILVDAVDLSNFARSVEFSSEHERIDVSGFSATGANEYLAGQTEQAVTVEFFGSYGATEVHATLYPIHRDREVVALRVAARPERVRLGDQPAAGGQRAASDLQPLGDPRRGGGLGRRPSSPPTRTGSAYHTTRRWTTS